MISPKQYTSKAPDTHSGTIIKSFKEEGVTLEELGNCLSKGQTIVPALYEGRKLSENFTQKQLYFLDFDSGITIEEITKIATENNLIVNAYYKSFSYSDELPKYRVLFISNIAITEREKDSAITLNLLDIFEKTADKKCSDSCRFFYGTNHPFVILSEVENDLSKYFEREAVIKKKFTKGIERDVLNQEVEKYDLVLNFNFEKLYQRVDVWRRFVDGEWLYDKELFGLATNMCRIARGVQKMKSIIEKGEYSFGKLRMLNHVQSRNYPIFPLENFSDSVEDHKYINCITACAERKDIEDQMSPVFIKEEFEIKKSLQFVRWELKQGMDKALSSNKSTLLISPTGAGKSYLLSGLQNVIIALPTHKLIREFEQNMTVDYVTTAELPKFSDEDLNKRIDELYAQEKYYSVSTIVNGISKGNNTSFNLTENDYFLALSYLNQNKACLKTTKTVITTHAKVAAGFFKDEDKTIIFDEDPRKSFCNIKKVQLQNIDCQRAVGEIYTNGLGYHSLSEGCTYSGDNLRTQQLLKTKNYHFDAYRNKDEDFTREVISFYNTIELDKSKKYIILSATPDISFIENFFERIEIVKTSEIETVGKVYQDITTIYSQRRLLNSIPNFKELDDSKQCITFKSKVCQMPPEVATKYYFNSEGSNSFSGKNLVCFGTPMLPSKTILLKAHNLGLNVEEECAHFGYREVEYNNMRFKFTTFKSKELQKIHFNEIEIELKQAIGRARLNLYDCKVFVYSGFPIEGSIFDKLPKLSIVNKLPELIEEEGEF